MGIFAKNHIEIATAGRCLDLASIMFAYGCDLIGIQNSALKKIQAPKKFDPVQGEKSLSQIGQLEIESPKTALLGKVMDCQDRFEWQTKACTKTGTSAAAQSCKCRICTAGVNRRASSNTALQKKMKRAALSS